MAEEATQSVSTDDETRKATTQRKAFGALRHRNYVMFFTGQSISLIGTWMQSAALGWLVFEITKKESYLGIVAAMGTIPSLVLTLPAGVVADRFSKKKIVILTQALAMVQAAILAFLAFSGHISVWDIVALAAFAGIISAVDIPARQSMVMELVGKEDLLNAVALNSSIFNGTRMIGPVVAGWLVAALGAAACFLVNAISYVAAIIALVVIRPDSLSTGPSDTPMMLQIREGLHYVRKNVMIRNLILLTAISSLFAGQYTTIMPSYAKVVLHLDAKGYGFLMGAIGAGAFLAAMSVAALGHKFRQRSLVTIGALVAPMGMIALSLSSNYILSLVCLIIVGFGMMLFYAVSNSMVQMDSPDDLRGRVVSVRTLAFMGVAPPGALAVGFLAQHAGVQNAIFFGALTFLAATLWLMVWKQGK